MSRTPKNVQPNRGYAGTGRVIGDEPPVEVMRPEHPWEGASAPNLPSVRSTAYGMVNQLRDPAIYEESGVTYLLYAVGGESGIAIARVDFTPPLG